MAIGSICYHFIVSNESLSRLGFFFYTSLCLWRFLAAPAQVTRLQVSNGGSTDSLQTEWERATGELDSYRLLLVHDSSIIKNQSVEANATGISFYGLRPGALYKVVVTTIRAGHSSRQTVAEGRTGETRGTNYTRDNIFA